MIGAATLGVGVGVAPTGALVAADGVGGVPVQPARASARTNAAQAARTDLDTLLSVVRTGRAAQLFRV
ncbi:MAG: hypothetical protein CVT65_16200 [Actinobacteria bacterium HGW-Actinobacteria-5]|nr:MAG: hypothetical protein CVT65_16200 [Actinobacteria bacterium HGW-Actinobacteria-5]